MKANTSRIFSWLPALMVAIALLSARTQAQNTNTGPQYFDSQQEAITALQQAAANGDKEAVHKIFGPDYHQLLTGDETQDKANFQRFSEAMAAACVPEPETNGQITLDIGTNNWPFPIPLVQKDGHWLFDTDAGKEEIINRHIGFDELAAIGVCRAYVTAQQQYFSKPRDGSGTQKYALKLKSTPGTEDGLYWAATNEPSPFTALVAEAHEEGYWHHLFGQHPQPFHGYLFRIMTCQGPAASGGPTNYIVNGNFTGGFALVAYPAIWGKSGVMTFIVNQDGKVFQRDFGTSTSRIASKMTEYNPDNQWILVTDQGIAEPTEQAQQ